MDNERLQVVSTSSSTADVSPVTLRESDLVRLVFKPMLINNAIDPDASVRGVFLYQKKNKKGAWEDFDTIPLTKVRAGEGYKLELHSAETRLLFLRLSGLYKYVEDLGGTPIGSRTLIDIDMAPTLTTVAEMLRTEKMAPILEVFLSWAQEEETENLVSTLITAGVERLVNFDTAIRSARLRQLLAELEDNLDNGDEDYWQRLLTENSWVLSQAFAAPLAIIRGQAYVGGKGIDNAGGSVVDFLYRNALTRNAVVIEIKTPKTPLLGPKYRNQVYAPSTELGGAIQQVLRAGRTLEDDFQQLTRDRPNEFNVFSPQALLVVGTLPPETDVERRRSFETYRNNLRTVDVVTFDELLEKVRAVLHILEG